jgi:hypothetical protein
MGCGILVPGVNMTNQANRIGKKGGARRVAEEFAKIRKEPTPKEAFKIVEENKKREMDQPLKKSARPQDIEI